MSNLQLELDYGGWTSSHTVGKKVVCLPSIPKNVTTSVEIPKNSWFEFGNALEWQHHLLEYIFEFLESKDLQSASLVSPVWKKLAKREFQKRISPVWINFTYKPLPRQSLHLCTSLDFQFSHTAMGLIVYSPDMIKLEQYVWLNKKFTLNFDKMTSFSEYLGREIVPNGVDYCTISCSTVYSSNNDNVWETIIYHGLLIPYIPKIRTAMFYCHPEQTNKYITNFINGNEEVKCVLMFSQEQMIIPENFLANLLRGANPKTVAIGGGLISSSKIFMNKNIQKPFRDQELFCISFLEEKRTEANFNAYSLVFNYGMHPNGQRCEAFESELIKLKETSLLRKHGILFKFCYFIHFERRETGIIKKHFPKYPLLGFGLETDWVIGWDTMSTKEHEAVRNSEDSSSSKKLKTGFPNSLHSRSLVLVLVTWGKRIKPANYTVL